MVNNPIHFRGEQGAAAAYLVSVRGMPLEGLVKRVSLLAVDARRAWVPAFARHRRRRAATADPFARIFAAVASASHEDTHPVLDADAADRFKRLILPQLDAAYSFARFLSRDADAAHDIVQDACLRACRHFGSFRDGNVRAWLFAIVRNCHHDWRTARARTARYEADVEAGEGGDDEGGSALDRVVSQEDTPEAALIRKTEAERVRSVLLGLSRPSREVLVLRELEHLSYRDIAVVTEMPIGTVMSRLARARSEFAQAWTRDAQTGRTRS